MTNKPQFVYVTYIATTPEKLWNALTDPETTRKFWFDRKNVSDWKPGSAWHHQVYDEASAVDIVGKIVESAPPRRLVLTWARPADSGDQDKHSRVTFEIEPVQDAVRLTVTHDEIEPGSEMLKGVTRGWPAVLSSLKTFLETGHAMPMSANQTGPPA